MKMTKRILCIVIALAVCLTTAVCAAEQTAGSDGELYTQMEVLRKLGFLGDYYDYNTAFDENVSRADFVRCVAGLIDAAESDDGTAYYYDVPKSHWAYSSINALTRMGVINGTGNKKFEPESPIDAGAAYKIMLSLMGYAQRAESDGGYPAGYIKTAKALKIYNGESFNAPLLRGAMISLIYNSMKTKVYNVASIKDGSVKYEVSKEDTLLSLYHDIYYDEDIVYGADMTATDGTSLNENEVKIGTEIYTSDIALFDKIGEEIEFFYYKENDKDKGNVIWVKSTDSSNVLIIDENANAKLNRNSFELSYHDGSKTKKVTLSRSITVIYNGAEAGENIGSLFEIPQIKIKLVKTNGTYSVAVLEKAENIVADNISTLDKIVYDKVYPVRKVDFNAGKYDYISVRDASGNALSFENITADMVLSTYLSLDGKYLRVIVSSEKVSGAVDSVENCSDGTKIAIGGKSYTLRSTSGLAVPNAGDNVTLFIDCDGYVAYVKTNTGDYFAAYVYKFLADNGGVGNKLKFKMLSQDGKILELECADKVTCDGERRTSNDSILSVLNKSWGDKTSPFKPQIALITQNSTGKITGIDTAYVNAPYESEEDTLSPNMAKGTYTYKWTGFFGGHGIIDANTVIFSVPNAADIESARDKAFSVKSTSDLTDGTAYTVSGFKTKSRVGAEQYVVLDGGTSSEWNLDTLPFLVSDKVKTTDDEGRTVEALKGYNNQVEITAKGTDTISFADVKPGMLLRLKYDSSNQVDEYKVLFDPYTELDDNGKIKAEYQTDYRFDDSYGIVKGYVNDVVDGIIKIGHSTGANADQIANKQSAPILVYDRENDREPITPGRFADADTYYNCGDACSIVVMQSYHGTPKFFVIYK